MVSDEQFLETNKNLQVALSLGIASYWQLNGLMALLVSKGYISKEEAGAQIDRVQANYLTHIRLKISPDVLSGIETQMIETFNGLRRGMGLQPQVT